MCETVVELEWLPSVPRVGGEPVCTPDLVCQIYDYIDAVVLADRFEPPPPALAEHAFNSYDWDARRNATSASRSSGGSL